MSDPTLVEAFRRQCRRVVDSGGSAGLVYLVWREQPGIEEDDMVDVLKEFDLELRDVTPVPHESPTGPSLAD